jgi:phage gp37-like protein
VSDQLSSIEAAIVARLAALGKFKTVGAFAGESFDVEQLLARRITPAAFVILSDAGCEEAGGTDFRRRMTWTVLIGCESRRAQADARKGNAATGAIGAYELIDRVLADLHSNDLGLSAVHVGLIPQRVGLAFADDRLVVYAIDFLAAVKFAAPT